jgi:hypothetical protein
MALVFLKKIKKRFLLSLKDYTTAMIMKELGLACRTVKK